MATTINGQLKQGFIWIGSEEGAITPYSYRVMRLGGVGVIHKIDPTAINGSVPVTVVEYEQA